MKTTLRLTAYRAGDPDGPVPIYDAGGSAGASGRWHEPDTPVIYAALDRDTAIAEKLRQGPCENLHVVAITIPPGTPMESVGPDDLPGWRDEPPDASRAFGARWVREGRSAILLVPSETDPSARNVVINPAHPAATGFTIAVPERVDAR